MSFGLRRTLGVKKGGGGEGYLNDALSAYRNIASPDYNAMMINDAAVNSLDPTARNAQLDALGQISNIYKQGGMTAIDKSRLQKIQDSAATQARGAREAIAQNAAMRGIGGSGLELAQSLQGQQAASDTAARQAIDVNSAAQQRALDAMQATGQLGGQISAQDLQRATAQDEIQKFNAGIRQQQYENDLARVNGMAGIYGNLANAENERQKRKNALIGAGLNAYGQIVSSAGSQGGSAAAIGAV